MPGNLEATDDGTLIAAVRRGRHDAYAELYRRHASAVTGYARRLTRSPDDAADAVAEAFTRLFGILQRGMGPTEEFRPYLMRTVRNLIYDRCRMDARVEFTDQASLLEGVVPFRDVVVERFERKLVGKAFASLPPRWQTVLWLTCVEGRSIESASEDLGTSANTLTSLAYRAREGLRQAYLQANLPGESSTACEPFRSRLGPLVRGALGPTQQVRVHRHLDDCSSCRRLVRELREINATLRSQASRTGGPALVAGGSQARRVEVHDTSPGEGDGRATDRVA